MKNFIQPGHTLDLTAPTGGVLSGQGYVIGALFVIAGKDAPVATLFPGKTDGVFSVAKLTTAVFAQGDKVFWDNTNKRVATTATGLFMVGTAVEAAGNGVTTARIRLDGIAVTAAP